MTTRRAVLVLGVAGVAAVLAWYLGYEATDVPQSQPASAETAPSAEALSAAALLGADEKNESKLPNAEATESNASDAGRTSDAGRAKSAPPAEVDDRTEMRFQVRWGQKGFCGPKDAARLAARSALLATFVAAEGTGDLVSFEPGVSPRALKDVQQSLDYAVHRLPMDPLEPKPAPKTYVYKDVEQMLSVSCVNKAAIGYYDGDIHIAGDSRYSGMRIQETIVHEYIHYLLHQRGIRLPMWLHEGMAMQYAHEHWWDDSSLGLTKWLGEQHIPFNAMATAFPYTSDERFALAAYYQSQMMFEFAFKNKGSEGKLEAVLEALAQGRVRESEVFSAAAGLTGDALEGAWSQFLTEKQRLFELLNGASSEKRLLPVK